ncbi:MAG: hypothetical protein PHR35_02140 [Kiritimatiellae bacterium]|nr:hypothetical protein [Kiritimatiellia bacterium]
MWSIFNRERPASRVSGKPCAARTATGRRPAIVWIGASLMALALAMLVQGCATEANGDMPWSTPQPWEGSVPLPSGMMRE